MEQEGHASVSRIFKIEEEEITQNSTVQNMDDNPFDKSVCYSVVDLTDDACLLVFSYLGTAERIRVARVCSRWRELARISWKSITRLSFEGLFPCRLKSYRRGGWKTKLPEICLEQCGTRLQCLDLSSVKGYHVTPRLQDLVGHHFASLQELNLSCSDLDNTALTTLAKRLPRLRSLNLNCCNNIGEDGLGSALNMLHSLESLNVGYIQYITGEFFSQAPQSLTEVLAVHCSHLTDGGVRFLAERCPNLEAIDISHCRSLTGLEAIRHLAKNCPKLKRLMSFCSLLWNESTFVTLFNLPLLEELRITAQPDVTDQLFCELSTRCPRLTAISLSVCDLTDAAFSNLCPWLHLESIDLSLCHQVTDEGLIRLSATHTQLKKVCLNGCRGISDKGVGRLVSDHPNLLELDIRCCPRVTDGVLPMLESSLKRRQYTQPLTIWLISQFDALAIEKLDAFRENTRCIVNGR